MIECIPEMVVQAIQQRSTLRFPVSSSHNVIVTTVLDSPRRLADENKLKNIRGTIAVLTNGSEPALALDITPDGFLDPVGVHFLDEFDDRTIGQIVQHAVKWCWPGWKALTPGQGKLCGNCKHKRKCIDEFQELV